MHHKSFYGETFFEESKSNNLVSFKYAGGDLSILYTYIFGPFAEFLVANYIPENIALNNKTQYGSLIRLLCLDF